MEISKEHPYEDACKILGIHPVANYKSYKLSDETRNFIKLETVAKALNQGWRPNTSDPEKIRYYIWGYNYTDHRKPCGFLLLYSNAELGSANTSVGLSLELKDEETAIKFGKLCKSMIVKHLFNRDDHENFELRF